MIRCCHRTSSLVHRAAGRGVVEGDRGAGVREKRGWEGYGRRKEKGREAGLPRWREPGEEEKNFAILRNILQ